MGRILQNIVITSSNTPITNLTYVRANFNDNQRFIARILTPLLETEKAEGRLLNGTRYSHPKFTSEDITFIISADELNTGNSSVDNARMNVLKAFFTQKHSYIGLIPRLAFDYAYDDVATSFSLFEVIVPPGIMPITYLNDMKALPEITFNVRRKGVL